MTDSENSAPQDDSDEDIYKDFAEFNFEDELAKLEGSKETYKQEALNLSDRVKKLTEENEELKKLNKVLKKNLSTLLKTAKAEVQRKDSVISELRAKVDSFTFKRRKPTKDKHTSTKDLEIDIVRNEMSAKENKISKSFENRTSSESEYKSVEGGGSVGREENSGCDTDTRINYYRVKNHCGGSHEVWGERLRGSQGCRFKEEDHRDSRRHRNNHQGHLKYDSLDKRRSGDGRFPSKGRRDSREGRSERRDESPERRRKKGSRKDRSRSRERSSGSKGPSIDRRRSVSSSVDKVKERSSSRHSDPEPVKSKNETRSEENRKRSENSEKGKKVEKKQKKEKPEKRIGSGGQGFETRSPLDALYSELVAPLDSRSINSGPTRLCPESKARDCLESEAPDLQSEEGDWTRSFKNLRASAAKPITLYSRRMMRKLSREAERLKESQEVFKEAETEKEPGELTDDENEIESSKEFQELTKVAAREDNHLFKEPLKKDSKTRREPEGSSKKIEDPVVVTTIDGPKEIGDVIEFSPFKNNYKLIEISPVKPETAENVLDFYSKLPPPNAQTQKEVESSILSLLSSMVPPQTLEAGKAKAKEESPEKSKSGTAKEGKRKSGEEKEKNETTAERKKSEENLARGKRGTEVKKAADVRNLKRRRESEGEEDGENKKQKLEESKKKKTSRKNSKSEPETGKPEAEKIQDDISFFEFFKPLTEGKEENARKEISPVTDFKMSLTGVVCLETPDKRVEQMIYHVVDSKSAPFSPFVGPKCVDMTPRRLLKNDLMLTDSEDEAAAKGEEEEGKREEDESEGNSECDSDSGASDFVDLL